MSVENPVVVIRPPQNPAVISNKPEGLPPVEYFDTPQASVYLGLSTQWLEIARHKGIGPAYIKMSTVIRYKKTDLDAYMCAMRRTTAEAS